MQKKFDIYKFLEGRPLSYSALNSFSDPQWGNPEKWYQSYIKGVRQSSKEMTFGSDIDTKFQKDPTFVPEIPRYDCFQYKVASVLEIGKNKIPLTGFIDQYKSTPRHAVRDLKTGKNPWTQKKADETDQLTFYALTLWLIHRIKPEDIDFYIDWLPTYERADLSIGLVIPVVPVIFKTKRTMSQVGVLHKKIKETLPKMEKYVNEHK